MKLKDLKEWVNSLTETELEQNLLYNSEEYSLSGRIDKIEKAKEDLYYTGEDDPAPLYTLTEIQEDYEEDEIKYLGFFIEIPKGSYYIKF